MLDYLTGERKQLVRKRGEEGGRRRVRDFKLWSEYWMDKTSCYARRASNFLRGAHHDYS